jgi:hypothetical protein
MTTNIIFEALLAFNTRVLPGLGVPTEQFNIRLKNGKSYLPRNPYAKGDVPIILVPSDILRDLPIRQIGKICLTQHLRARRFEAASTTRLHSYGAVRH